MTYTRRYIIRRLCRLTGAPFEEMLRVYGHKTAREISKALARKEHTNG